MWKRRASIPRQKPSRVREYAIALNQAIRSYLDAHNADPGPFRWIAPADTVIGQHQRG